jgi:Fe-Mn family superoxide dismutase
MGYEIKNYHHLLGNLTGFLSDKQLEAHFTLYEGYVKKINEIEKKLKGIDPTKANYSFNEFSELKRREAVAFNGAFLHELYFENISSEKSEPVPELETAVNKSFGSFDKLFLDLKEIAISTPGWAVLTFNKVDKQLHTYLLEEHHIGLPVHQEILLIVDSWEHAYMIDYALEKAKYLDNFKDHINWNIVNERFVKVRK